MQTINLKFEKLDRLPVPTCQGEVLFAKDFDGNIYACEPSHFPHEGRWEFDVHDEGKPLNRWTYCHIKVTATETDFKVGDRVKFEVSVFWVKGVIKDILTHEKGQYAVIESESGNVSNQFLADLSLIPNE